MTASEVDMNNAEFLNEVKQNWLEDGPLAFMEDPSVIDDMIESDQKLRARIHTLEKRNERLRVLLDEGFDIVNEYVPGMTVWIGKTTEALEDEGVKGS